LPTWPTWWDWELDFTPHLLKRMVDRSFTEVDLRGMLERAVGFRPDVADHRWVVETRLRGRSWEVIVEPEEESSLLIVITAYPLDRR